MLFDECVSGEEDSFAFDFFGRRMTVPSAVDRPPRDHKSFVTESLVMQMLLIIYSGADE